MQVWKRGKSWSYRFETAVIGDKRRCCQKGGFRTKKEAELAGGKALKEYSAGGAVFTPSSVSVSDYYDLWISEYCEVNCAKTTIDGYRKRIKNIIKPRIGKYKLSTLSPEVLQNLLNDLFNLGYSRNTICSIKGMLTGALDYAIYPKAYIKFNPAKVIRLPSPRAKPDIPSRKKVKNAIPTEQLTLIFNRFPEGHPAHLPLQIAYQTGMREGEIFGLLWDDIDFDNSTIHLKQQVQNIDKYWTFVPPKYDSKRDIYIGSELLALLKKTKEKQSKMRESYGEYYTKLYVTKKSQIVNYDTGQEIYLVNVRDNGTYIQPRILQHVGRVVHYDMGFMNYDFHSLRHTHSTELYAAGAPLLDIKERLGHCKVEMTIRYTHDSATLRNRTAAIIETIYNKDKKD